MVTQSESGSGTSHQKPVLTVGPDPEQNWLKQRRWETLLGGVSLGVETKRMQKQQNKQMCHTV